MSRQKESALVVFLDVNCVDKDDALLLERKIDPQKAKLVRKLRGIEGARLINRKNKSRKNKGDT